MMPEGLIKHHQTLSSWVSLGIWHLIEKHKQLPGLLYEVKLAYMQVQDVTGRAVSQVKKFNLIQTSNSVLFQDV